MLFDKNLIVFSFGLLLLHLGCSQQNSTRYEIWSGDILHTHSLDSQSTQHRKNFAIALMCLVRCCLHQTQNLFSVSPEHFLRFLCARSFQSIHTYIHHLQTVVSPRPISHSLTGTTQKQNMCNGTFWHLWRARVKLCFHWFSLFLSLWVCMTHWNIHEQKM